MLLDMFKDMPIIMSIFVLFLCFVFYIFLDAHYSIPQYYSGTVIEKHYVPQTTRVGTGVGVTGSGQPAVVSTRSTQRENFLLMLKTNNNEVVTAESSATLYYSKNLNDTVTFVVFRGKYTDNVYKIQAMQ